MRGLTWIRIVAGAAASAFLVSCAEIPTTPTTSAAPTPMPGYFNDDGLPGEPKIVVSISEQRAYFYKGKRLIGESTVSTGKAGFSTPPGSYKVVWKHADHVSSRFGDYVDGFGNVIKSNVDSAKDSRPPGTHFDGARMPFAMFFRGGYAMHQGYVPPYAASHGCIRLPAGMAELFFNAAPYGTPVIVKSEAVSHNVIAPPPNPLLAPGPVPVRSTTAPMYNTVRPAPVPVRAPSPAAVRPATVRSTVPVPSPSPAAVRSTVPGPTPVPVYPRGPSSLHPSPTPVPNRSRGTVRYPPPAPTPTPTPVRSSLRPRAL